MVGFATARDVVLAPGGDRELEVARGADEIVAGPGDRQSAATRLAGDLCALGKPLVLDDRLVARAPGQPADARAAQSARSCFPCPRAGQPARMRSADVEADARPRPPLRRTI